MPDHAKAKLPDATPSGGTTLDRLEATIVDCALDILAGFDRQHVPPHIALAICGVLASRLLSRVDDDTRAEFFACFEQLHDA